MTRWPNGCGVLSKKRPENLEVRKTLLNFAPTLRPRGGTTEMKNRYQKNKNKTIMQTTNTASMKGGSEEIRHASAAMPLSGLQPDAGTATGPLDMRQKRQIVIDRMAEQMRRLLRTPASQGLRWTGTLTDLAEAIHVVWLTGQIPDDTGRPMTFREMMRRACHVLHRRVPANAHSLIAHAGSRKGIRSCPVLTRYVELVFGARLVNPFQMDITQAI